MGIKRYNSSALVAPANIKRWNGSAWVKCNSIKRWNGSAWVNAWQSKKVFKLYASSSENYISDYEQNACGINVTAMGTTEQYCKFRYTGALTNPTISFSWSIVGGESPMMSGYYVAMFMYITINYIRNGTVVDSLSANTNLDYSQSSGSGVSGWTQTGTYDAMEVYLHVPGFSESTWTTGAFCSCIIQNFMVNGETYTFDV